MSTDPYKAPDADLEIVEDLPPRPVRGIVSGLIIDFAGTFLLAFVASIIYGFILALRGVPISQLEASLTNTAPTSLYGIILVFLGLFISYVAGFYGAKISRARDYLYPGIQASISVVLGSILSWSTTGLLVLVFLNILGVVAVLLGARTYLKRNQRLAIRKPG